ncbi:very short patch repair endonuclease [Paenibacillus naphthalenovorans]|nr:very short patch repair endonuclease [Paenibacillus naphthalenovorans]
MADKISTEARSRNMSAIRSTHTKIEDRVSKELWHHGFRFRRNVKNLRGKPDIAIKKHKIVIFIDSCFWHSCNLHGHIPKSNVEFWVQKLERNKQRDIDTTRYYSDNGWNVLRVWEHDLKENFQGTIHSIIEFITSSINFGKTNNR